MMPTESAASAPIDTETTRLQTIPDSWPVVMAPILVRDGPDNHGAVGKREPPWEHHPEAGDSDGYKVRRDERASDKRLPFRRVKSEGQHASKDAGIISCDTRGSPRENYFRRDRTRATTSP
jgi:hypothetical protein